MAFYSISLSVALIPYIDLAQTRSEAAKKCIMRILGWAASPSIWIEARIHASIISPDFRYFAK